jgi:hypothetical protein
VDPRGRISCEGVEFVRQSGENRTAFLKRYLDIQGAEGWSIGALHPLVRTEASYIILQGRRPKRPLRRRRHKPAHRMIG